ncbi:hypothetical protein GQ44DRAFT_6999 [Phaeosphaeriaceae sp. PMI808]|nr:hypothetical protein GQ44DRAFT_6999 [Phaeosphaeriaceae sp. PMI808]
MYIIRRKDLLACDSGRTLNGCMLYSVYYYYYYFTSYISLYRSVTLFSSYWAVCVIVIRERTQIGPFLRSRANPTSGTCSRTSYTVGGICLALHADEIRRKAVHLMSTWSKGTFSQMGFTFGRPHIMLSFAKQSLSFRAEGVEQDPHMWLGPASCDDEA